MYFIAEIGSNHNGDFGRARDLIIAAKRAGFDAVKFQLFDLDRLFTPPALDKVGRAGRHPFEREWLWPIAELCRAWKIDFGLSLFHADDVNRVKDKLDFVKLSSYDILNRPLLETVAREYAGPVYLSTGLADAFELATIPAIFRDARHQDLRLMHCISKYPCPVAEINPDRFLTLQRLQGNWPWVTGLGWSDHTRDRRVLIYMAGLGARYFELHFDLNDKAGAETKTGHVWLAADLMPTLDLLKATYELEHLITPELCLEPNPDMFWRADPADGQRPLKAERVKL